MISKRSEGKTTPSCPNGFSNSLATCHSQREVTHIISHALGISWHSTRQSATVVISSMFFKRFSYSIFKPFNFLSMRGTSLRHQRLSKRKKHRMGPITAELVKTMTSEGSSSQNHVLHVSDARSHKLDAAKHHRMGWGKRMQWATNPEAAHMEAEKVRLLSSNNCRSQACHWITPDTSCQETRSKWLFPSTGPKK